MYWVARVGLGTETGWTERWMETGGWTSTQWVEALLRGPDSALHWTHSSTRQQTPQIDNRRLHCQQTCMSNTSLCYLKLVGNRISHNFLALYTPHFSALPASGYRSVLHTLASVWYSRRRSFTHDALPSKARSAKDVGRIITKRPIHRHCYCR